LAAKKEGGSKMKIVVIGGTGLAVAPGGLPHLLSDNNR